MIRFLIPILVSLGGGIAAQGLLIDDAAYSRLPKQSTFGDGSKSELEALNGVDKIDLRPFCPRPQHQGTIGSCTGWSSGYGAQTILAAIQKNLSGKTDSITKIAFSALFIYNQIKAGDCLDGSYIGDGAELLKNKGNLPSKTFDKIKSDCKRQPTDEEFLQAQNFRIKDYMTLFEPKASEKLKVQKTKLSLAQKRPVVIGMNLKENFMGLKKDDEFWYPNIGNQTHAGAHAMVVVGFDDGKEAFEIMNSWGPDWGNGGFIWVKYKDFGELCFYGFQFIPEDLEEQVANTTYTGSLALRAPFYDAEENLKFTNQDLTFNGKYYELAADASLEANSILQPNIFNVTGGMYLYAFSYDPDRQIKVHWPRDARFDERLDQTPESAIITTSTVKLAIPGEYSALQFKKRGKEYLCFLFSKDPINNFNGILEKLKTYRSGDFYKNLNKAVGDDLANAEQIIYKKDAATFSGILKKGRVVPLVVEVYLR